MDEPSVQSCPLFLNGGWVDGEGPPFTVPDKYRQTPFATVGTASAAQAAALLDHADRAFAGGAPAPHERGAILDRAAALLAARTGEITAILQAEAGFTASDARGELGRAVQTLRLSADEARHLAGDVLPLGGAPGQEGRLGLTLRVPLGVVLAITPFNSPVNTVLHKIAPAFAAGNAAILKPSPHTPVTANVLADIFAEAGMPDGFLSVLHCGNDTLLALLDDPRIRFIAFTGSTEVGRVLQARAGLRKTQMELGSIAFTILNDDADLDRALPKIVNAGYRKAGQVCTSIQVLLAHRRVFDETAERLAALAGALAHGDPRDPDTVVGPLISPEAARRVEAWIDEALAQGARRLAGGPRQGAVVPPTLLVDVADTMKVASCEVFGPVISLLPVDDLDTAIGRVNATPYGLATGLFTNRLDQALAAAHRLRVGGVHINETSSARVDVMPYGGSKDSGFGREGPRYAVHEMSEERVVTITMT